MSRSGSPVDGEVVRKARRRARFQSMRSSLTAVFALMFLAAAGGFAWGMWDEVGTSPQDYRFVAAGKNASVLAKWSAGMARLIARLQYEEQQGPPERLATPSRPTTTIASNTSWPGPTRADPVSRQPRTDAPLPVEPKTDILLDPGSDPPEPAEPEPVQIDPRVTNAPPPPLPTTPVTKGTEPATKPPELDPRVAEVLEKAHKNFDIAWKYHQKARPDAPPAGRDTANKMAIQYFKLSKQQYEAVLGQKIPADLRERIQTRLVDLNGLLYWSMKMSRIK